MNQNLRGLSNLRCMQCGAIAPLYETVRFTCSCGGLYDVEHDFGNITAKGPKHWQKVFDDRAKPSRNIRHSSGVWRFHELIMPSLTAAEIITLGEGIFPILFAGKEVRDWVGGNTDLWIVPEGLTQTGSFKDHGGTVAMSVAKAMGIKTIACASTGDTSAMAAAYAAAAGLNCVVVLPAGKITNVQLAQPVAHGAKIITIPGSFDDCMRVVRELCEAGKVFPINSINPTRIEGHQATVFLMAQFLQWQLPDVFVVPVGNGSNSSSIGKAIRLLKQQGLVENKECKIIGVQSDSANPLATSWESVQKGGLAELADWKKAYQPRSDLGETAATAARIGNPVSFAKVMREICASNGAVLTVTEAELLEGTQALGASGFSCCPQTGTALAGLRQAVARGFINPGATVAVVSTATSLKFPDVAMHFGSDLVTSLSTCDTEAVASAMGV